MNGILLSPPLSNGTCIITEFSAKTLEGKGGFVVVVAVVLLLLDFLMALLYCVVVFISSIVWWIRNSSHNNNANNKNKWPTEKTFSRDESFVFCLLTPGKLLLFSSVCVSWHFLSIRFLLFQLRFVYRHPTNRLIDWCFFCPLSTTEMQMYVVGKFLILFLVRDYYCYYLYCDSRWKLMNIFVQMDVRLCVYSHSRIRRNLLTLMLMMCFRLMSVFSTLITAIHLFTML